MMMKFVLLFFFSFRVGAFFVPFKKLLSTPKLWKYSYIFFQKIYLFTCIFFSMGWANIWGSFSHDCADSVTQQCLLKDISFQCTLSRCLPEGLFLEFLLSFYNLLFILLPIPHCIDYGGFLSLEIRQCESCKFVFQKHIFLNLKDQ